MTSWLDSDELFSRKNSSKSGARLSELDLASNEKLGEIGGNEEQPNQ
jgi:hypothetical protein